MRKYCHVLFACLFVCCAVFPAWSYMPTYPDDAEFKMCAKMRDWEECARDELQRTVRVVKQQYRTILTTPSIMKWHSSADENVAVLRDMYDSWTAFRTRLCSLSDKAAIYTEPLTEEKTACNLYYALHHKDHLDSVLLLMMQKAPAKQQDFDFLTIYDHDEDYQFCINANQKNCLEDELKRSSKEIKDYYKTFLEDEFVGKWNNGPDLKRGNYRDMYDSWIAYRNRMCSLAVWAYQSFYGEKSMNLTQCLQFYNREKLETMMNILLTAHSEVDDAHETDGDPSDENHVFHMDMDDGGLAEGQTITPLDRHIDSGMEGSDDVLVSEEPQPEKDTEPKPEEKHDIPEWAQ